MVTNTAGNKNGNEWYKHTTQLQKSENKQTNKQTYISHQINGIG